MSRVNSEEGTAVTHPLAPTTREQILHDALVIAARNTAEEIARLEQQNEEASWSDDVAYAQSQDLRGYLSGVDHALALVRELWPELQAQPGIPAADLGRDTFSPLDPAPAGWDGSRPLR